MKCPNCDTENREKAKFCDECGFPLTDAIMRASYGGDGEPRAEIDTEIAEFPTQPFEPLPEDTASMEALTSNDNEEPDETPEEEPEEKPLEDGEQTPDREERDEFAQESDEENLEEKDPEEADEDFGEEREEGKDPYGEPEDDPFAWVDREPEEYASPDTTMAFGDISRYADGEEYLVDDGYRKPDAGWHDGRTMRMAPITDDGEEPKSKDFLASSTAKRQGHGKLIGIIVAIVVAVAAVVAFTTYTLQIWGGKSVPDVTGLTELEATEMLEGEGYAVRSLDVKSDDTEGLVLVMDPSAGSRAEPGSEIVIHIATARLVPEIVGKTKEEAAKLLEESGFTNVAYEEERSSRPRGEVVGVEPEVGTRAKSNELIKVKVAKPYTVPDISNKYLEDAQKAIEDAGLVPYIEYVYVEDVPDGMILGTIPSSGTEVQEGSYVGIQISRSREAECIALTQAYLAPGNNISVGAYGYEIVSIQDLTYLGNNTVAYSVMAKPYVIGFGETAYFSEQPLAGQIVWSENNQILSII